MAQSVPLYSARAGIAMVVFAWIGAVAYTLFALFWVAVSVGFFVDDPRPSALFLVPVAGIMVMFAYGKIRGLRRVLGLAPVAWLNSDGAGAFGIAAAGLVRHSRAAPLDASAETIVTYRPFGGLWRHIRLYRLSQGAKEQSAIVPNRLTGASLDLVAEHVKAAGGSIRIEEATGRERRDDAASGAGLG